MPGFSRVIGAELTKRMKVFKKWFENHRHILALSFVSHKFSAAEFDRGPTVLQHGRTYKTKLNEALNRIRQNDGGCFSLPLKGGGLAWGSASVPIPKFVAFYGATFRTSESKGH